MNTVLQQETPYEGSIYDFPSWEEILDYLKRHVRGLVRARFSILSGSEDDLCQETLLRLVQSRYDPQDCTPSLVRTVAFNAGLDMVDRLRAEKRGGGRETNSLEACLESGDGTSREAEFVPMAGNLPENPAHLAETRESLSEVVEITRHLRNDLSAVLLGTAWGLESDELARRLGITTGTLYVRLSRARAALRDKLRVA